MQRILRAALWCFVAMIIRGLAAAVSARPLIYPSLGPTAIMLFANPLDRHSSPRNVLIGHFIGAVGIHRVVAAATALALTAGISIACNA